MKEQQTMTMVLDGYSTWLDFTLACPDAMPSKTGFSLQQSDGSQVQGSWLAPGVLQLVPQVGLSQETWVLSAGIHGNETAPIEWLNQLVERWRNREWVLKAPTLLIMGNPRAMVLGQRFISTNLNRLFNPTQANEQSSVEKTYEEQRACILKKAVDQHFQAYPGYLVHYDLHTAIRGSAYQRFAVCPVTQSEPVPTFAQFLAKAEIQAALLNTQTSGSTFSYYSATCHQAEAATVELGKVHPFGSNNLTALVPLTKAVLARLGCQQPTPTALQEEPKPDPFKVLYFKVIGEIIRETEHFEFYVDDVTKNFTAFKENSLIARDLNYEYRVGSTTEYILFPNPKVQIGHRAALMVAKLR